MNWRRGAHDLRQITRWLSIHFEMAALAGRSQRADDDPDRHRHGSRCEGAAAGHALHAAQVDWHSHSGVDGRAPDQPYRRRRAGAGAGPGALAARRLIGDAWALVCLAGAAGLWRLSGEFSLWRADTV